MGACKFWWQRYNETASVERLPDTGRTRSLTELQETEIVEIFSAEPFKTASSIAEQYNVHPSTIIRTLRKRGRRCRIAAQQTKLTEDHKLYRLAFCETMLEEWDEHRLNTIVFTDEKTFSTDIARQKHVYRPDNTRYRPQFVQNFQHSGRITAGFWGSISINGPGELIAVDPHFTANQYMNIITQNIIPMMNNFEIPHVFMQDNSPVHTAGAVMNLLSNQAFEILPWPPLSPDLNPIENVWSYITYDWPAFDHRDVAALRARVQAKWNSLHEEPGD